MRTSDFNVLRILIIFQIQGLRTAGHGPVALGLRIIILVLRHPEGGVSCHDTDLNVLEY